MLLALTRRDACRQALLEVMAAIPGWQPPEQRTVFVSSFAEAHRAPVGQTTCAVDLGSVAGSADEVIGSVRRLLVALPWLNVVLVAPHLNPDLEAAVIYGLRDVPTLGLVQPSDLRDATRWTALLRDQFVEHHALKIESDLRQACPAKLAAFFEDPEIRALLRCGARLRRVRELVAASGSERVGVWRRFKRRWGRSPSEMLTLFRVLWAAHLRHEGLSNAEVARLLGFRDAHHLAHRLGARLRLSKTAFNTLAYPDMVSCVVACLAQRASVSILVRRAHAALRRSAQVTLVILTALGSGVGGFLGALRVSAALALGARTHVVAHVRARRGADARTRRRELVLRVTGGA